VLSALAATSAERNVLRDRAFARIIDLSARPRRSGSVQLVLALEQRLELAEIL
jgi:hypothetical protein